MSKWKYFVCDSFTHPIVKVQIELEYRPYNYVAGPFKLFTEAKQAYMEYLHRELTKVENKRKRFISKLEEMKDFRSTQVVVEPDCY